MASLDDRRSQVAQLPMRTGAIPHLHVWTERLCTSISQTARKEKRIIKIEKDSPLEFVLFSSLFSANKSGHEYGVKVNIVTTYGVLNRTFWNSERKEFLFVLKVSTFLRNTRLTITLGHPKKIVTCNRVTTIGSIAVSYRLHGEKFMTWKHNVEQFQKSHF